MRSDPTARSNGLRILFFSPDTMDFCAHGLFHGLRSLLGPSVVDIPKAEFLYDTFPEKHLSALHGLGFTLGRTLEDIDLDRYAPFGPQPDTTFDLTVIGNIHTQFGRFVELAASLRARRVVVIDGSDSAALYPYLRSWRRNRLYWPLPRAHTRVLYFKREWTPETRASRWYGLLPPLAGLLPAPRRLRPIGFSIPAEKLAPGGIEREQLFATHIVDAEIAEQLGRSTGYHFSSEQAYYADLRASRFAVTTRRAGWDTLRHYEIAANGCVPCFRDLEEKPATCAPHGLVDGINCLSYRNHGELMRKVEACNESGWSRLHRGAVEWAQNNTTRRRAAQFLSTCGFSGFEAAG